MSKITFRGKTEEEWKEQEVGNKPLVLICHQGNVEVKPEDGFIILSPEVTVYHGERVDSIDPEAKVWVERILGYPMVAKERRGLSDKHIIGLCDLVFKLTGMGVTKIFIQEPETYLHPKQQLEVGDFLVYLTTKGK